MIYENARRLLQAAVDNGIIKTVEPGMKGKNPVTGELSDLPVGDLILYKSAGSDPEKYPEGWYHQPLEELAQEFIEDDNGALFIARALNQINKFPDLLNENDFDGDNADQDFIEYLKTLY